MSAGQYRAVRCRTPRHGAPQHDYCVGGQPGHTLRYLCTHLFFVSQAGGSCADWKPGGEETGGGQQPASMRWVAFMGRGSQLVGYPLSFYHGLETGAFETGFGGYAPRDEDGTPWQLPHDVETHSSVAGYLGGPCDPTASPALLC